MSCGSGGKCLPTKRRWPITARTAARWIFRRNAGRTGTAAGSRYYRYLRESASGEFVGEIAYHFDGEKYLADVIVYAPYRRRGYGAAGLALLCAAAKENGVGVLYDDIAADNPSVALFLRCGFSVEYRTDQIVMVKKVLAE